jgi:hypothetical protein
VCRPNSSKGVSAREEAAVKASMMLNTITTAVLYCCVHSPDRGFLSPCHARCVQPKAVLCWTGTVCFLHTCRTTTPHPDLASHVQDMHMSSLSYVYVCRRHGVWQASTAEPSRSSSTRRRRHEGCIPGPRCWGTVWRPAAAAVQQPRRAAGEATGCMPEQHMMSCI